MLGHFACGGKTGSLLARVKSIVTGAPKCGRTARINRSPHEGDHLAIGEQILHLP